MREHLTIEELKQKTTQEIETLQNKRFSAICEHILPQVPYYQKLFRQYGTDSAKLNNIQDWHKKGLPLIKKATYMKQPEEFIVKPDEHVYKKHLDYLLHLDKFSSTLGLLTGNTQPIKDYYTPKMIIFSGGTESGNPTPVILTKQQKHNTLSGVIQIIAQLLIKQTKTTGMNLFPYGPHLAWHTAHEAFEKYADLNLCTAAGGALPTEQLVRLAQKTQPNIITGMHDYIRNRFIPIMKQNNYKIPQEVTIINGAQKMTQTEREKLMAATKTIGIKPTIIDLYGASELKTALLPECKPNTGFHHIAPLSTIIKTVKVNNATQEQITDWDFAENGYMASWNIDGAGTQLHGYLLGDTAQKVTTGCRKCGLNTQVFHNINRIKDIETQLKLTGMVEEKIKGTRINLAAIREEALKIKTITEVQIIVRKTKKGDQLELHYTGSATQQELNKLLSKMELKPKIVKTTLEKMQTGIKFKPIVKL